MSLSIQDTYALKSKKRRIKPIYIRSNKNSKSNYSVKSSISRSLSAPNVHTFVRSVSINQQVGTTGFVPQVGVTNFSTFSIWFTTQDVFIWGNGTNYSQATMPGITDLAGLFDEIKIDAIEMTMHVANDAVTFGSGNASGVIVMATDYNDHIAPATSGDVQQYRDCKAIPLRSDYIYKEVIKPRFLTYSLDANGGSTASTPIRGYQRSNLQTEHYGKKGAFLLAPHTGTIVFSFKFKYSCKTPK